MICMVSFWRNDAKRQLEARARHLLSKSGPLRWLWVVGDSDDATADILATFAEGRGDVDLHVMRTNIQNRYLCLSQTAAYALAQIRPDDDYVLIHESDLRSPFDVAERFLAHAEAGRCPIAGWPILELHGRSVFYDVWAYRARGTQFTNHPPYHAVYKSDTPFTVDSVGSCWMFHAEDARRGLPVTNRACVEMCDNLRMRFGRTIWVDPTIEIIQPRELWTPTIGER